MTFTIKQAEILSKKAVNIRVKACEKYYKEVWKNLPENVQDIIVSQEYVNNNYFKPGGSCFELIKKYAEKNEKKYLEKIQEIMLNKVPNPKKENNPTNREKRDAKYLVSKNL